MAMRLDDFVAKLPKKQQQPIKKRTGELISRRGYRRRVVTSHDGKTKGERLEAGPRWAPPAMHVLGCRTWESKRSLTKDATDTTDGEKSEFVDGIVGATRSVSLVDHSNFNSSIEEYFLILVFLIRGIREIRG
jgi:hypothetical protein